MILMTNRVPAIESAIESYRIVLYRIIYIYIYIYIYICVCVVAIF